MTLAVSTGLPCLLGNVVVTGIAEATLTRQRNGQCFAGYHALQPAFGFHGAPLLDVAVDGNGEVLHFSDGVDLCSAVADLELVLKYRVHASHLFHSFM